MFMTILCLIMGVTLFLFLMYHFKMIKAGLTTNEKIKKSDITSFLKKEIEVLSNFKYDLNEEKIEETKKVNNDKIEMYKRDLTTLQNMKSAGFIHNLKEIFNS